MLTVTAPAPSSSRAPARLVRCSLGAESYLLPLDGVLGIQRAERIRPNESGDKPVGWLREAWEGVPVYSLADFLDKPGSPAAHVVLVLDAQPGPFGLLVNRVGHTLEVGSDRLLALPAAAQQNSQQLFQAAIQEEEGLVLAFAPEHLVPEGFRSAHRSIQRQRAELRPGAPAGPLGNTAVAQRRVLLFSTTPPDEAGCDVTFGLSLTQVLEIQGMVPLLPVPTAPAHIVGLLSWRDRPVPVIDLALRFGLSTTPNQAARLLIARTVNGRGLVGIPITNNVGSVDLPLPHRRCDQDLPLDRSLTRGVFDIDGDVLVLPDLDVILGV